MRPKIKRNIKLLNFPLFNGLIRTILYTKYYFELKKHLYTEEKIEMYKQMKHLGFVEGIELTRSRYNSKVDEELREKENLVKRYANEKNNVFSINNRENKQEEIDSNYKPSVVEIKTFKTIHSINKTNLSMLVTDKVKGYYYCLIESSYLNKPKVIRGKDYSSTYSKAIEIFNEIDSNFNKEETPKPKKSAPRKKKSDNIDISHVQKAMGIDSNSSQQSNDDTDDLKDILDGLF